MDILNPPVGAIIDYTYNNQEGWIEVTSFTHEKICFKDNFAQLRDYEVNFYWSTWKVHVESTINDVRFRSLMNSTWEV